MPSTPEPAAAVLLHGQPGAGAVWHPVVAALGDRALVLAPDRPGYGSSPLDAGGVAWNVAWLASLLDDEAPGRPAVVVAHSWAGSVALEFARRHPERTRGIVLVASVGPGAITRADRLLSRPLLGTAAARPLFWAANPVLRRAAARRAHDPEARAALLTALEASHTRGVWRTFLTEQQALVDEVPAVLAALGAVTVPSAVVAGTRDRIVPFRTAEALAAGLPGAELVPVHRGGHQLPRTHPHVIAEVVAGMLG